DVAGPQVRDVLAGVEAGQAPGGVRQARGLAAVDRLAVGVGGGGLVEGLLAVQGRARLPRRVTGTGQPLLPPEQQAPRLAAAVGTPVAAQAFQVDGALQAPRRAGHGHGVAGLVRPRVDPELAAGVPQHLRHERQPAEVAVGVEGGEDLLPAADPDQLAGPQRPVPPRATGSAHLTNLLGRRRTPPSSSLAPSVRDAGPLRATNRTSRHDNRIVGTLRAAYFPGPAGRQRRALSGRGAGGAARPDPDRHQRGHRRRRLHRPPEIAVSAGARTVAARPAPAPAGRCPAGVAAAQAAGPRPTGGGAGRTAPPAPARGGARRRRGRCRRRGAADPGTAARWTRTPARSVGPACAPPPAAAPSRPGRATPAAPGCGPRVRQAPAWPRAAGPPGTS